MYVVIQVDQFLKWPFTSSVDIIVGSFSAFSQSTSEIELLASEDFLHIKVICFYTDLKSELVIWKTQACHNITAGWKTERATFCTVHKICGDSGILLHKSKNVQ